MSNRVLAFDVARALAIFGMVLVNFKLVLGSASGSEWLKSAASLFEGRASALFVVLAGVGIALLTRGMIARGDLAAARGQVARRGLLLFNIGLAYTFFWTADILHFYGVYFLLAAFCLGLSQRRLLVVTALVIALFPLLVLFFDYEQGWDWNTLEYDDLWTLQGFCRHLFFNGFHPVFPWAGFLLFGLWLGRLPLEDMKLRRRLMVAASVTWLGAEFLFYGLRSIANGDWVELLTTAPMPPMPQYLLVAASLATLIIIVCYEWELSGRASALLRLLANTGRLSLTLYVAHVLLGMTLFEVFGWIGLGNIELAWASTLFFFLLGLGFSQWCIARFNEGPLESLFRRVLHRSV